MLYLNKYWVISDNSNLLLTFTTRLSQSRYFWLAGKRTEEIRRSVIYHFLFSLSITPWFVHSIVVVSSTLYFSLSDLHSESHIVSTENKISDFNLKKGEYLVKFSAYLNVFSVKKQPQSSYSRTNNHGSRWDLNECCRTKHVCSISGEWLFWLNFDMSARNAIPSYWSINQVLMELLNFNLERDCTVRKIIKLSVNSKLF